MLTYPSRNFAKFLREISRGVSPRTFAEFLKLVMSETIFAICQHCNCMILARCGVIWQAKFTCTPYLSQFQVSRVIYYTTSRECVFYIRLYTLSKLFEEDRFAWCDFDSISLEIILLQIVKYLLTIISCKFSNRVNKFIFSINAIITAVHYSRLGIIGDWLHFKTFVTSMLRL